MKNLFRILFSISLLFGASFTTFANETEEDQNKATNEALTEDHHDESDSVTHEASTSHEEAHSSSAHDANHDKADEHSDHHLPAAWAVIPFVLLLLMIATGPLFFEHFWHKYYPVVAILLGLLVIGYYTFTLHDTDSVIHSLAEYVQFIALLAGLFVASGGIMINVDKEGKPFTNVVLLLIGAVIANIVGTTGASMLLIRPFIRLNKDRIKPYHIVFFIFMVSNVGGALTPIGDPPLFLGFLKGVPFEWTIIHDSVPWAFAVILLAIVFFVVDKRNKADYDGKESTYTGKISITGGKNFIWISLVIAAVFIDPNVWNTVETINVGTPEEMKVVTHTIVPSINVYLHDKLVQISFIREIIMLSIACLSYFFASPKALKGNEFEFEPIKEVAFIFIGIFFTMMPALQLVAHFAEQPENAHLITINTLYWLTGALSGVLDNAPTYVNFLTAGISVVGGKIGNLEDVKAYAAGAESMGGTESILRLTAISIASVFFGAMTYIGNAPNFMVKSIAEQSGIKMPAFVQYVIKYSIPILLPILVIVWFVFIYLDVLGLLFG